MLIQLEMRLNVEVDSMVTPSSDMDESNLEFAGTGNGEGQEEEPSVAATSKTDLGDLLHDLEHSSSSSSDSDMED